MSGALHMLYGTTNDSDSVPRALLSSFEFAGPVYSDDGRLILNESFSGFAQVRDTIELENDIQSLLADDDYVETWRIWDCYENDWANFDLAVHRFEHFDLAIRRSESGMCAWRGAIDTQGRVLASRDPKDCEQKCWQWRRAKRLSV
ncbi:MAG: hypothetical protein Q4D34_08000 [Eggerthellaceae bacterium]|nr:hypothetical protein [Eggerthellaceae bacterium]